jgi:glycosyltransferase involved in cell wall biosynthesis
MQKTTFPYEIIIADDCSTDGTSAICAEYAAKYPDKIRHIRGEYNVGGVENERRAIEAAQGEYVARSLEDYLHRHPDIDANCSRGGTAQFFTTESPERFKECAAMFLHEDVNVQHIDL